MPSKFVATLSPHTFAQPPFERRECESLSDLMDVLAGEELVGAKSAMPLVFAAEFKEGATAKSGENIARMHRFLAIDYDDGKAEDVERIYASLVDLGCGFGMYTTYKHTDASPRLRFVVVLSRDVSKTEYMACWRAVNRAIGGLADPATKDLTRGVYVWGRVAEREAGGREIVEGPELDVERLLGGLDAALWAAATVTAERPTAPPLKLVEGSRILALSDFCDLRDQLRKSTTPNKKAAFKFLEAAVQEKSWGKDGEREPLMNAGAYEIASAFLTENPVTSLDIEGSVAALSQAFWAAEGQGSKKTLADFARKVREKIHVVAERKANPSSEGFFPLTEMGMAERLARAVEGRLYFVPAWDKWIAWNPGQGRWVMVGAEAHAYEAAKLVIRALQDEGRSLGEDGEGLVAYGKSCESFSRTRSIVSYAARNTKMHLDHDRLDQQPMQLNVGNGTVDLRTGAMGPHDPKHLLTRTARVEHAADVGCPRWEQFIDEVTGGDVETARYLQRFCGYLLTGETREHEMLFCVGTGRNGKSVLFNTLYDMLGSYATKCPQDLLVAKKHENHPQELANLHGRRLALISETDAGQRWAAAKLKELTGGERVSARRMNENAWEFVPTHKFVVTGNAAPSAAGDDKALWARIRLMPFNVSFLGREDRTLPVALANELPGILNWCVAGCLEWLRLGGTKPSAAVVEATEEYRQDNDVIQDFLDECCVVRKNATCKRGDAFRAFEQWQARSHDPVSFSPKMFAQKLKLKGVKTPKSHSGNDRFYEGFELKITPSMRKFGKN